MEKIMCLIEDTGGSYGAFFPFILGVVTTGTTIDEVKKNAKEVLEFYKETIVETGESFLLN